MNKEEIIINDVLKGNPNTTEITEVVKWFATDEGQGFLSKDIDDSIQSLQQGDDAPFASTSQIPSEKMLARINGQIRFQKVRRIALRVAAVAIPFVLLAGFLWHANSRHVSTDIAYAEIRVPKGEQKQLTLEDGSRVYLSSDTRLRYPKHFAGKERKVYLEGEGYFIVEKNPAHPFIVEMNQATVRVLGTSFNVEAYPETAHITLQLDEGSIKLTAASQKEYLMVPGERLTYNRENGDCILSQKEQGSLLENWENETFSFHNAPLRQVLETLGHWHNVDFQIENPNVWDYSYTFVSGKNSLETILSDMEKVSPVSFRQEGKTIKISMK